MVRFLFSFSDRVSGLGKFDDSSCCRSVAFFLFSLLLVHTAERHQAHMCSSCMSVVDVSWKEVSCGCDARPPAVFCFAFSFLVPSLCVAGRHSAKLHSTAMFRLHCDPHGIHRQAEVQTPPPRVWSSTVGRQKAPGFTVSLAPARRGSGTPSVTGGQLSGTPRSRPSPDVCLSPPRPAGMWHASHPVPRIICLVLVCWKWSMVHPVDCLALGDSLLCSFSDNAWRPLRR